MCVCVCVCVCVCNGLALCRAGAAGVYGTYVLIKRLTSGADGARGAVPEPPKEFICPITRELMQRPVFTSDGHTYERVAILEWLRNHDTSPRTLKKLKEKDVRPNHALRMQISDYRAKHSMPALEPWEPEDSELPDDPEPDPAHAQMGGMHPGMHPGMRPGMHPGMHPGQPPPGQRAPRMFCLIPQVRLVCCTACCTVLCIDLSHVPASCGNHQPNRWLHVRILCGVEALRSHTACMYNSYGMPSCFSTCVLSHTQACSARCHCRKASVTCCNAASNTCSSRRPRWLRTSRCTYPSLQAVQRRTRYAAFCLQFVSRYFPIVLQWWS